MSVSHNLPTRFAKVIWFGQEIPSCLEPVRLRAMASRIRDELDVQVAQNGPSSLEPEAVLAINKLLLLLKTYRIPQAVLRWTRIHLAIMEMCGKATRWPRTLVDEAESVVMRWENQFGRLKRIRPLLFDKGGRLHSVCLPEDLSRTMLTERFRLTDPKYVDDTRAYQYGSMGFEVGSWWISCMFAFRDGIIDSKSTAGGVCFGERGAYAVVLKGNMELDAVTPTTFTFRSLKSNKGSFKLISKCHEKDRPPVRVLRSHLLGSLFAPVAGIRYDGLYRVTGYAILPTPPQTASALTFMVDVHFERVDPTPFSQADKHPVAAELDDYKLYKKLTHMEKQRMRSRAPTAGHSAIETQSVRSVTVNPSHLQEPSKYLTVHTRRTNTAEREAMAQTLDGYLSIEDLSMTQLLDGHISREDMTTLEPLDKDFELDELTTWQDPNEEFGLDEMIAGLQLSGESPSYDARLEQQQLDQDMPWLSDTGFPDPSVTSSAIHKDDADRKLVEQLKVFREQNSSEDTLATTSDSSTPRRGSWAAVDSIREGIRSS